MEDSLFKLVTKAAFVVGSQDAPIPNAPYVLVSAGAAQELRDSITAVLLSCSPAEQTAIAVSMSAGACESLKFFSDSPKT